MTKKEKLERIDTAIKIAYECDLNLECEDCVFNPGDGIPCILDYPNLWNIDDLKEAKGRVINDAKE